MNVVSERESLPQYSQILSNTKHRAIFTRAETDGVDGEVYEPSLSTSWSIDKAAFDQLLSWLDRDPERAGQMYEIIRRKLIRVFAAKRCVFAEDLADETFNRVARRLPQIKEFYVGDPLKYFFGVARKIYLEYLRSISAQKWVTPPLKETVAEVLFEHLEDCIGQLQHKDRELILTYYQGSGRTKIDRRKLLAEELGIPIGALRLRVHRIVSSLRKTANSRQTDALLPNASLLLD